MIRMIFINYAFFCWHGFSCVHKIERNFDRMISYWKWNVKCMKNKIDEKKMNMKQVNKSK